MEASEKVARAAERLLRGESTPARLMGVPARVVEGLFAMGLHAKANGRIEQADNAFQRCVLFEPYRADYWIALAATRQAAERFDEAAELFQVAGVLDPAPAAAAYAAACFALAGQTDRARVLAGYVRDRGEDLEELAPWLRVAEAEVVS